MSFPSGVSSENVPGGLFQNSSMYSYCGPLIKVSKRLSQGFHGVNQLDHARLNHDVAYTVHKDIARRNHTDNNIPAAALKIALANRTIMSMKSRLGMGVGMRGQRCK